LKAYLQKIFQIQQQDWKKLVNLSILNFQIVGTIAFGTIISTSLFVKKIGVEYLPNIYIANSIAILISTFLYLAFADKVEKLKLFRNIAIAFGIVILIARGLIIFNFTPIYSALYIISSLIFWIFFTQFWAIAVEVCNVRESRRMFSYIVSIGLFGGIISGIVARYIVDIFKTANLLLVWALFLFLIIRSSKRIPLSEDLNVAGQKEKNEKSPAKNSFDDLADTAKYFFTNHLVRIIIICFLIYGITVYFLDFQFNRLMNLAYPEQDKLTGFYGIYSGWFYGITFLLQIFFTTRIIKRLGVVSTILTFPIALTIGFAALTGKFNYISGVFAKFIRDVIGNSLVDSSYPVLFSPMDEKYTSKALALVEGLVIPVGTGLAGLLLLILRSYNPIYISISGILLGIVWIFFTFKLKKAYHGAFIEHILTETRQEEFRSIEDLIDLKKGTTLAVLKKAMYDKNEKLSLFAIRTLGRTKDKEAIKPLVELLINPDLEPVKIATVVEALGDIKDTYVVFVLSKYLDDPDERVRANAVESLGKIGGPNVLELIEPHLKDSSSRVRINTAIVLWKFGHHEKANKLISEIFLSSDQESRIRATYSLSQIGSKEMLPLLIEASYDKNPRVRFQSIEGLSKISDDWAKDALIQMLKDVKSSIRETVRKVLVKMQNITDKLLTALNSQDEDIKYMAALVLAEKGEEKAIKSIIDYCVLQIRLAYQNLIYIQALLSIDDKTPGINLFVGTTTVKNQQIIEKVLRIISYLEKSVEISLSIRRLKDKDENIKADIIELLETTDVEYKEILKLTIPLLEDISLDEKIKIAGEKFGLQKKQYQYKEILEELLNSSDEWQKGCAIKIIGEIKEDAFLERIIKETESESKFIKETALEAVMKINPIRGKRLTGI